MKYLILCSSDNALSVKGGGNAWTILKLLEKFYDDKDDEVKAVGIFADTIISNIDDLRAVDECMNERTEAYMQRGELPFKRWLGVVLFKKFIGSQNFIYRFLAPVYYLFLSWKRNLRAKNNLKKLINEFNINYSDIVILDCHDPFSAYFLGSIKFPCRKISVTHSHEIGSQAFNMIRIRKGCNFIVEKINLFIEKRGYQKCDYVSFPSRGAMNTLIDDVPNLANVINNKKIEILYTGIKTQLKKELGQSIDKSRTVKLLFVGRLVEEKGFDLVLEAVKILNKQEWNIVLDVVGFGDTEPINKFIKENNLKNIIFVKGVLPRDEVLKLMIESDILVAPHRKSVFDLVMLEAMHVGLPIIATAVGGNLELIRSENEGMLVETNNAHRLAESIKVLVNNYSLRVSMANNARKCALDFFSEEAMFQRYKNFFENISK